MGRVPMSAVAAIVEARAGSDASRRRLDPASVTRERATLLSTVPLFADLSRRHLRQLSKLANETNVRSGGYVVQAGQPGRAFYVILEGRAKVVRGAGPSGRRVATLGPGDFFGELALLDGGPRTASVIAEGDLVAIRVPRSAFRRMLRSDADVGIKLLENLASIVRKQSPSE